MPNKKLNKLLFGAVIGIVAISLISFVSIMIISSFNSKKGKANKNIIEIAEETTNETNKEEDSSSISVPPTEESEYKLDDKPEKNTPEKSSDSLPSLDSIDKNYVKVEDTDHIRGDKNAPITIVEYSDFQCPYCVQFHDTMKKVMQEYEGKVRWVYKHFPLKSHAYSNKAAQASECAAEQNKFWEYNDALFKNQADINDEIFTRLAIDLGLNTNNFNECLNSEKYKDEVDADYKEGQSYGVSRTPGNFINSRKLRGAMPYEMLKSEIDKLL